MFVVAVVVLRSPLTDLFIFDLADARAPVSADIIRELDEFKNILLKWHVSKCFFWDENWENLRSADTP